MLDQVLALVSNPPSSLVYHFLVLFSVEAALAMAFSQWLREREERTGRLTIALLVVGLSRAVFVGMALLAWQGVLARSLILPPVERSVDALTALAVAWAFVTMDDPIVLKRNRVADILGGIGVVLILAGSAIAATRWFQVSGQGVPYNSLLQDFVWGAVEAAVLAVGLVWMRFRSSYVYDAFLKGAILVLFGAGAALHLVVPSPGDIAAATRLGLAFTMPMLAAVTYRHIVDKLLGYDAFHETAGETPAMSEEVVEAIRAMPVPGVETEPAEAIEAAEAEEPLFPDIVWETEPAAEEADALPFPDVSLEEDPLVKAADELSELGPIEPPTPEFESAPVLIPQAETLVRPPSLPEELSREYPNAVEVIGALDGLVASLDVHDAANHVARAVAMALRADVAAIIVHDEGEHSGTVVAAYDNIAQTFLVEIEEGVILALDEQRTMVNALGRLRQERMTPQRNMRELRSFFKVLKISHTGPAYVQPLHADEHRLGVLVVASPYAKVSLSNAERSLLNRMGPLVTAALLNATAYSEKADQVEKASSERETQAEAMAARADVLEKELEDTRKHGDEMRAYIEDLERQVELATESAKKQVEALRQELQEAQEQAQEAQEAQQEAQRQAQEARQFPVDDERVMLLERELDQTRTASQVELAALRARLATSSVSQHEVMMLQEQLMAKAREVISLQARVADAQFAADTLRDQRQGIGDPQQIADLQGQVRRQTEEIEKLRARLAEAEANSQLEFASIQKQVQMEAADRQAMNDLQARLTEHSSLIRSLEEQLAEKSRALVDLGSSVGSVDSSLRALDQQLQRKTKEAAALEASLNETRAQAQERINELQAQLAAAAAEANNPGNDEQAEAQAAIIGQLEAELADKSASLDRLEGQLTEANLSLGTLEEQLAAASVAVETAIHDVQRVDTHDEVITSIAQELRTPMSSVTGYTDLLLGESVGIIGALQRKFLQRIKANTERMASLLDNLVSISALDSGQLRLEPAKVDVTKMVEEGIAVTASQFQEKNLTLRLQIDDDLPAITADQDAVYQIVAHLLTNASLATPVDGEVLVSASQVEGTVPGPQGGDHETSCVLLSVSDAGGGISPVDQARVFMRKYRADNPLIEGLGDTGVALSIAKTLVDAHGGRIWLESEPGVGSTFNVLLPVDRITSEADAEQTV